MIMKINFIIEKSFGLKYLGCATVSQQLLEVLKKKGVDVRLNSKEDDFDIVHAHTFGPLAMSQQKKTKSIISAHSTPSINEGNIVTGKCKFWKTVYKKIYNKFDYVFAVSETSVKELKDIGILKPIYVLENGVNKEKFYYDEKKGENFRKEYNFSKDDYVVLNVAQITPRKGIYDFIKVAENNPDTKFLWVGGFPYFILSSNYLKLKNIIKKAPKNLTFTGFVEDIIGAYSGADLLFTPTYRESFGLTIIEASACKLPVLVRPIEVFKDLFGKEVNYGSNIDEFSHVINRKPVKKYTSLPDKYDLENIADKAISLYNSII
jgi:glycosyltransferase involved in cell wall biosynthesis